MVNRPLLVVNRIAAWPCSSGGISVPTMSVTPMATPTPREIPRWRMVRP